MRAPGARPRPATGGRVGRVAVAAATAVCLCTGVEAWADPPAVGAAPPSLGPGPAPWAVDLDLTLDPGASRATGHARLRVVNDGHAPRSELALWLYPNHLATRSAALGDVNYHWLYPGRFSPGAMQIQNVRVAGVPTAFTLEDTPAGARTIARVALPVPLPPGQAVIVDVDFDTHLPRRYGSFGCDGLRCRLMGGFYPMPVALGPAGFDLEAPPARAGRTRVTLRTPRALGLVVDGQPVIWPGAAGAVTVESPDVPYATIVTDRVLRPDTLTVGQHQIVYLHRKARPPGSQDRPLPYVREDIAGLVLATAGRAAGFADAILWGIRCLPTKVSPAGGGSWFPDDPARRLALTLVEAPLRHQLVQVHGNLILVSDQIFGIFPAGRLRKYHQLELARAVFTAIVDAKLAAFESPADRDLATGVLAAYLTDLYAQRAYHRIEYAPDLLRPFDFVPAVDQLLYAPLLASSSSYFGDVEDVDRVRDDVRRFADDTAPSPRLIYNKLLDLIGTGRFATLARKMLNEDVPLRAAAEQTFGADLAWFWRQWLGPRPRVNYRLQAVRVTPGPVGSHVEIDVRREGDAIREPVEVAIEDRAGAKQILIWDDVSPSHRFEVDLPAGLKSVEVDPRGRLVETALGSLRPSDDPLYDNRQPRRWRLLYEGFGALLDVSALTANFEAAFLLKPQHDLRHAFLLTAFHSETIDIGVGGAYFWNFGAQSDKNTLSSSLLTGFQLSRINPSFGLGPGDRDAPGFQISGRISLLHDTRDFLYDPWRAIGANVGVGYALTALDDGERLSQVGLGAEALRLFEFAPGHVLALDGSAAATFGDIRLPSQLTGAGGPDGLRGFFADELLSRAHLLGSIQLRDDYVSGLDWNLLHFTTVRGFAGTLFADAAAITTCDAYALSGSKIYYDVGYSFRVLHDAFGVYQQLLSIDFAVPLNRSTSVGTCLGRAQETVSRPPFVVLVSFVPSF
ncbi:MAG TPA: hypothetical protein VFG23_10815 [Polyangia bacterium]|nr:hypothetical protein [Polyangia bacterium]